MSAMSWLKRTARSEDTIFKRPTSSDPKHNCQRKPIGQLDAAYTEAAIRALKRWQVASEKDLTAADNQSMEKRLTWNKSAWSARVWTILSSLWKTGGNRRPAGVLATVGHASRQDGSPWSGLPHDPRAIAQLAEQPALRKAGG